MCALFSREYFLCNVFRVFYFSSMVQVQRLGVAGSLSLFSPALFYPVWVRLFILMATYLCLFCLSVLGCLFTSLLGLGSQESPSVGTCISVVCNLLMVASSRSAIAAMQSSCCLLCATLHRVGVLPVKAVFQHWLCLPRSRVSLLRSCNSHQKYCDAIVATLVFWPEAFDVQVRIIVRLCNDCTPNTELKNRRKMHVTCHVHRHCWARWCCLLERISEFSKLTTNSSSKSHFPPSIRWKSSNVPQKLLMNHGCWWRFTELPELWHRSSQILEFVEVTQVMDDSALMS